MSHAPIRSLKRCLSVLLPLFALAAFPAAASDLEKEQRWADQIVDELIDGDTLWLEADGVRFLSILTMPDDTPRGSVIIVHGIGAHPNWPQVVYPLRTGLIEAGWVTLSLQLPILANDAEYGAYLPLFDEVAPRLDAALDYLGGTGPIVVAAHSMGSAMTSYALRDRTPVTAFVGIGMGGGDSGPTDVAESISRMAFPVLDLYGEDDLKNVLDRAAERHAAGRSNPGYEQRVVAGANHFFDDQEETLIELVTDWLEPYASR